MAKKLYKITFLNHTKVYELYARQVAASSLWGFTEVGELVFDVHDGVVIDPTEERLRDEFGATQVLHLPMQSIVRIEEVERKGQSAIRDAATGEKVVTPFPLPAKPR
ncbi:DUF1820 family protein [Pseudoxanthomonas indica]|uniref:DUF1820 domain-containing protein n=1 Tax=Pseudoxanthomonas indica TaxID=428993 RepID=A0A1T5KV42_9GAMM|nr:DUF1820 family protein [Pseudoxanthomonas indica]GGD51678.1 hypothetical protein GCM10007235_24890 [Pseudoxanthomonas indica]SKC67269.1 hypothetical protein SAMN06296058_2037 [Pseudoxanthomonas indica]